MLGRLLIGIVKGVVIGGLLGFALVKLGLGMPGAVIAYLAAAITGVVIGLVAGKPIWAKDAKIEAGMKAVVGALLGAGLMYAARRWLTIPLPFALPNLAGANESLQELPKTAGTFGGVAMTALAAIAALLGGFYEADNTPEAEGDKAKATPAGAKKDAKAGSKRIAAAADPSELDELDGEADPANARRAKK